MVGAPAQQRVLHDDGLLAQLDGPAVVDQDGVPQHARAGRHAHVAAQHGGRRDPGAGSTLGARPRARRASAALGQLALEDLAGGVARQLVEELDLARDLVAREVGLDVVLELVGVDASRPRVTTTKAFRRWPNCSSSTPMTATSSTASWSASRSSTSRGKTFSPPETIISSSRPSTNRRPPASKCPTSPEDIRPPMSPCCRRRCSPRRPSRCRRRSARSRPAATSWPSSSKSLTTVPRGGRPAVPGRGAQVLGRGDRRPRDLGRAVEVVEDVAEAVHDLDGELAGQRRCRWRR